MENIFWAVKYEEPMKKDNYENIRIMRIIRILDEELNNLLLFRSFKKYLQCYADTLFKTFGSNKIQKRLMHIRLKCFAYLDPVTCFRPLNEILEL